MPAQDKTERATPKRREDVRKRGQIARSIEVATAVSLLGAWIVMRAFGQGALQQMADLLTESFGAIRRPDLSPAGLQSLSTALMLRFLVVMAPIIGMLLLAGFAANVLQVGLHLTPGAAKPQFSKINPINGFQRIFSVRSLAELAKSLIKLGIVGYLGYQVINNRMNELMRLTGSDFHGGIAVMGEVAMELLLKVGAAYVVLAAADYAFQKWQFERGIKMTKQEVQEEQRSQDLAPQIRNRIRTLQRQMARRRMMQRVPEADVVITNPTHYAVALRYDATKMAAPKVVAKGQRLVAQQIKELARKHGIPLVENKPLAQALFRAVDVDQEVPKELYKAVAEILAFIYRLKARAS